MENIIIKPIGIIRTPHKNITKMPIQPIAAKDMKGHIELYDEYKTGLKDIEEFSHITLLYYFHKVEGFKLEVTPFMDTKTHGIFATKAPKRPNKIGISTAKLIKVKNNILYIQEVDMLDKTPLLDIKPFFEKYDNRYNTKAGWLENNPNLSSNKLLSDERFK